MGAARHGLEITGANLDTQLFDAGGGAGQTGDLLDTKFVDEFEGYFPAQLSGNGCYSIDHQSLLLAEVGMARLSGHPIHLDISRGRLG